MNWNPLDDSAMWLNAARKDREAALSQWRKAAAENARLQSEVSVLRDTLERDRQDAERYRWIRQQSSPAHVMFATLIDDATAPLESMLVMDSLDAAIDKAMADARSLTKRQDAAT